LTLVTGNRLVATALRDHGVDTIFHIAGAPNIDLTRECEACGIRLVGVRHEQAAAAAAQAYARVSGRPGVCLAPAGPAIANMVSAVSHATREQVPIVALGGSGPRDQKGTGSFQEMDEIELMVPAAKHTIQVHAPKLAGASIAEAFRVCQSGTRGAVYVDLPADMLYAEIDPKRCFQASPPAAAARPSPSSDQVEQAIEILSQAERPLVVAGSGVIWSGASRALREFLELSGIPFFPTPQARGVVPDDHPGCFPAARSQAFRTADAVLAVGTRANFIIGHFAAPRWDPEVGLVSINIDAAELGRNKAVEVGMAADARAALEALNERGRGRFAPDRIAGWIRALSQKQSEAEEKSALVASSDAVPIHPLRLMKEIRELLPRNAVIVEDGHDTLGFCRHSIPSYEPGHRINPGTLGNVGVGVPFGMGAKAARPDVPVVVISGDSAFGWNGMEVDTCIREGLPITVIICNNAGITARSAEGTLMPGQDLGWSDYQRIAEAFGGVGIRVESPDELKPALSEAFANGRTTIVNVIVDKTVASATNTGFAGVMGESYQ
jgi:thiamine pyrophosphate-dependent acetolactate synthase large subunit-like protein